MASSAPLTPPPSYAPSLCGLAKVGSAEEHDWNRAPGWIHLQGSAPALGTAISRSTSAGSSSPFSSLSCSDDPGAPPGLEENEKVLSLLSLLAEDLEGRCLAQHPPCSLTGLGLGMPPGLEGYAPRQIPPPPGLEDQAPGPRPVAVTHASVDSPPGLSPSNLHPPPTMPPIAPPPVFAPPEMPTAANQRLLNGPPATVAPGAGSEGHGNGTCKPCVFVHKQRCERGAACPFCHLCDAGEVARRRKAKRAMETATKTD